MEIQKRCDDRNSKKFVGQQTFFSTLYSIVGIVIDLTYFFTSFQTPVSNLVWKKEIYYRYKS